MDVDELSISSSDDFATPTNTPNKGKKFTKRKSNCDARLQKSPKIVKKNLFSCTSSEKLENLKVSSQTKVMSSPQKSPKSLKVSPQNLSNSGKLKNSNFFTDIKPVLSPKKCSNESLDSLKSSSQKSPGSLEDRPEKPLSCSSSGEKLEDSNNSEEIVVLSSPKKGWEPLRESPEKLSDCSTSSEKTEPSNESIVKRASPRKYFRTPKKRLAASQNESQLTSPVKSASDSGSPKKEFIPDESYAVNDFKHILSWVLEREHYCSVLSDYEKNVLKSIRDSEIKYLKLFCLRLYTRQWKWHNHDKFSKAINANGSQDELKAVFSALEELQIIELNYANESVEVLLSYLNLPDVKQLCNTFRLKLPGNPSKEVRIKALLQHGSKQSTLTPWTKSSDILKKRVVEKLGTCFRIRSEARETLDKAHFLFKLTNPEIETISQLYFVLANMRKGAWKGLSARVYEPCGIFRDEVAFNRYYFAVNMMNDLMNKKSNEKDALMSICEKAFEEFKIELKNSASLDEGKLPFIRRFTAGSAYCSILTSGSKHLSCYEPKKVSEWLELLVSQYVYNQPKRGFWYIQLSILYHSHLKVKEKVPGILIGGLKCDNVTEIFKIELAIRANKLKTDKMKEDTVNELKSVVFEVNTDFPTCAVEARQTHENAMGRKRKYIEHMEDGIGYHTVEQVAINHYRQTRNFPGAKHCEGALLHSLFGLLLWDIIYESDVANVFISQLQLKPLDLSGPDFFASRQDQIVKRLASIASGWSHDELLSFCLDKYERQKDVRSIVGGDVFASSEELGQILACIGGKVLAEVCRRMAGNYKQYRSGLPDLFLWNAELKTCLFAEVKGEKDKLSTKQIAWLNYLRSIGAEIEVCYVNTIGSRSARRGLTEEL